MEQEEFNKAYQFGVESGGAGIRDPSLFGCETVSEAKQDLARICSTPLWDETHVYRVRGTESRLVGINARSKSHADEKLERKLSAGIRTEDYLGELTDLLGDSE